MPKIKSVVHVCVKENINAILYSLVKAIIMGNLPLIFIYQSLFPRNFFLPLST